MAVLTSAGITFGDSTTQTTAAVAGVTSLNGQTGAITNTTSGAIGSYTLCLGSQNTSFALGATIAGSSLRTAGNTTTTAQPVNNQWASSEDSNTLGLSGTWRAMNRSGSHLSMTGANGYVGNIWCRIS
jgi:hypothetical protein